MVNTTINNELFEFKCTSNVKLDMLIQNLKLICDVTGENFPVDQQDQINFIKQYDFLSCSAIDPGMLMTFLPTLNTVPLVKLVSEDASLVPSGMIWNFYAPGDKISFSQLKRMKRPLSKTLEGKRLSCLPKVDHVSTESAPKQHRTNTIAMIEGALSGPIYPTPEHTLISENSGSIHKEIEAQLKGRKAAEIIVANSEDRKLTIAQHLCCEVIKSELRKQRQALDEANRFLQANTLRDTPSGSLFGEPINSEAKFVAVIQEATNQFWWATQKAAKIFYGKELRVRSTVGTLFNLSFIKQGRNNFQNKKIYQNQNRETSTSTSTSS